MTRPLIPLAVLLAAMVTSCTLDQRMKIETVATIVDPVILEAIEREPPARRRPGPDIPATRAGTDPQTVDFGVVAAGARVVRTVRVTNLTDTDLTIARASVNQPCFAVVGTADWPQFLAGRGEAEIEVAFQPSAAGPCNGLMTVRIEGTPDHFVPIPLKGIGAAPPTP